MKNKEYSEMMAYLTRSDIMPEDLERVGFKSGTPFQITDEKLATIDKLIKETNLDLKSIGKQIGFGTDKKPMDSKSKVFQEYIKKYGKPDQERLQTRGVKLTKNSPYVQKVIKLREELGSTNAVAKELGKDNKSIRNVLSQFRPDLIGKQNIPGPETGAKAQKKRRLEGEKAGTKLLSDSEKNFNKQQELLVRNLNDDFKKNPNKVLNNPRLINLLNLKLENGNIVSKNKTKKQILESINRQGGLLDIEHISDIATGKKNVQFPVNRQITTYNVNSGFLRSVANYVNKPNADPDKIANIEKTLKEYGLRVSTNKGTIGAPMISASDNVIRNLKNAGIETSSRLPKLGKVAPVVGAILAGTEAAQAGPLSAEEAVAAEGAPAPSSPLPTALGAGAGAATLGTKTGRSLLGKAFRAVGTPFAGATLAGTQIASNINKGENIADAVIDPIVGLELSFPGLFRENISKITSNPRVQQLLTLGRFGRALTPVGLGITAAGAGVDLAKFTKDRINQLRSMSPEDRQKLQEQSDAFAFNEFSAAGGGIAKLAGKRSGPAPESGPTPQGLDFLMKRVR